MSVDERPAAPDPRGDLQVLAPATDVTPPMVGVPRPPRPAGARGVRQRLARLSPLPTRTPTPAGPIAPVLSALVRIHPKADTALVQRAYEAAERAHSGQFRRSGEPYIIHPIEVSRILAELGATEETVAAGLLHDTVEDTDYTLAQLTRDFGPEIAALVDGVTKLDRVALGENAAAETVRKMVVAMSHDIRVLIIKLADRLHNARTWKYVSRESAQRKARETLEIYAPLAHRLGLHTIKWELEDLSFATVEPRVYDEIVRMVAERAPTRQRYLDQVMTAIRDDAEEMRIQAQVTGRPKHYYSIYQKMIVRGREFDEIFDLIGVRVIVNETRECYAILGQIHARWTPVSGRFKDYIAVPKLNVYQSLHTTVVGPEGRPIEMQIRTWAMHQQAEYGIAAHWRYKQGGTSDRASLAGADPKALNWVQQLMEWQQETSDPGEFLDLLRFEIGSAEVYVFTPAGDIKALQAGSTPVDFAYAVHTEVGHRCMGAKVNGKMVPLNHELQNGDVVEIFTSKAEGQGPSAGWLEFAKTARARTKIRQWFVKSRREDMIERGRTLLAKEMRKHHSALRRWLNSSASSVLLEHFRVQDIESLYAAIGEGTVSAQSVIERVIEEQGGAAGTHEDASEMVRISGERSQRTTATGILVDGMSGVEVRLPKCCTPVPGDPIAGFVTRDHVVAVHRIDCPMYHAQRADTLHDRTVHVEWGDGYNGTFVVSIVVEALDRSRLLADVTRVLSDMHLDILAGSVSTSPDRIAHLRFTFETADPVHLEHILRAVRAVEGVTDVRRLNEGRAG